MKTTKRIISALLIAVVLLTSLCSCYLLEGNPTELVALAEEALAYKTYTVESQIKYTSSDEKMQAALNAFSDVTALTEVNGDSFRITMSFEKDGRENGVLYTYVDGTLYTELSELGVTTKTSKVVTDTDKSEILSTLGEGASIGIEDFETVKALTADGATAITCTSIKDAPLNKLVFALEDQLTELDATVAIKDVVLIIGISGGLYDYSILTCEYVITTPDNVYTLTMNYRSDFTYTNVGEIVAPTF